MSAKHPEGKPIPPTPSKHAPSQQTPLEKWYIGQVKVLKNYGVKDGDHHLQIGKPDVELWEGKILSTIAVIKNSLAIHNCLEGGLIVFQVSEPGEIVPQTMRTTVAKQ